MFIFLFFFLHNMPLTAFPTRYRLPIFTDRRHIRFMPPALCRIVPRETFQKYRPPMSHLKTSESILPPQGKQKRRLKAVFFKSYKNYFAEYIRALHMAAAMLLPPLRPMAAIIGMSKVLMSSFDSTTLTKPTGTAIMPTGLSFPDFISS